MNKITIGIDYSNICKNYNTAYLDRDNKDPETSKCMKAVVAWMHTFLAEISESFNYKLCPLNAADEVKIDDVASNRFLFFSLEKGITIQSFVLQSECIPYDNLNAWAGENEEGLLILNDEDGEGIYLYLTEGSNVHQWISEKLKDFSLDEMPFQAK